MRFVKETQAAYPPHIKISHGKALRLDLCRQFTSPAVTTNYDERSTNVTRQAVRIVRSRLRSLDTNTPCQVKVDEFNIFDLTTATVSIRAHDGHFLVADDKDGLSFTKERGADATSERGKFTIENESSGELKDVAGEPVLFQGKSVNIEKRGPDQYAVKVDNKYLSVKIDKLALEDEFQVMEAFTLLNDD